MIYYDQLIDVDRLNLYAYTESYARVGSIMGLIMPVKAEDVMLTDGDPAQQFKLCCDLNENIKEADKITCDGDVYIVKTVRRYKFGSLARIEAYINKPNN